MPDDRAPEKLSIVVFSGEFDKVHYALVLASAAAAMGTFMRNTTLHNPASARMPSMMPGACTTLG